MQHKSIFLDLNLSSSRAWCSPCPSGSCIGAALELHWSWLGMSHTAKARNSTHSPLPRTQQLHLGNIFLSWPQTKVPGLRESVAVPSEGDYTRWLRTSGNISELLLSKDCELSEREQQSFVLSHFPEPRFSNTLCWCHQSIQGCFCSHRRVQQAQAPQTALTRPLKG